MENGLRPPIQMAAEAMRTMQIGFQGEQNAQQIRINVEKWLEKWPDASIHLMLTLPGEKTSYPANTRIENGELIFLPGYGDTQKAGHGAAYVAATRDGTHLAVSETVLTEILPRGRGGDISEEAPEAQAGWVADVIDAAHRAEEAAKRAENAQVTDEQVGKAVESYLDKNPIDPYTLPVASADTLGGVKVGSGLRMNGEVLNAEVTKEKVEQLSEEIGDLREVTTVRRTVDVVAASHTDGYYTKTGVFTEDVGREYKIVPVEVGENYELTTQIGSANIPAIIYRDANDAVLSYDMLGASGTSTTITAEIIIPEGCTNVIVQSVYVFIPTKLKRISYALNQSCEYIANQTVPLGPDILAGVNGYYVADTGWSGNKTVGYTHTAGRVDSMSFSTADIEEGAVYICEFDTDYIDDEFVNVGIGSQYRILVYKGISHLSIPLLAVGAKTLYFTPLSNRTFTISNVTLRKVGGMDAKQNIELFNVLTSNHSKNLGYWNVILGKNTAENAVGTTRTLAIGYAALNALQGGHRNVALGTFTMSQMIGGENNVAIGSDAMLAIKQALDCIAIGKGAMYNGQLVEDNVAIGHYALTGSASSSNSKRNVAIGKNAGWYAYGQDNVYIGYQAGYKNRNTNGNVCIGKNAYGGESGNHNTCIGEESGHATGINNSTAIGYYAQATKSNQMVIGNKNVTEYIFAGKRLIFNNDGTVTWEAVE